MMAIIKSVRSFVPKIGENCYLSETAHIIGDVVIGGDCSVWFNSVIRGDVNSIRIGNNVNIQDGSVLHCTYEKTTIEIGDHVSIGHNVIIHGAKIESNVLIGMGAIIMDNCLIKENSIIAAGAVLLENTIVESYHIYGGVPAKKIKEMEPSQVEKMIKKRAENYLMYSGWYK